MLFPDSDATPSATKNENSGAKTQSRRARQIIINKYLPGDGITPHVDLLSRFDDGIIGLSLGSGTVMDFRQVNSDDERSQYGVYLPPGCIIVLTGEARYRWTHGIAKRTHDWVQRLEHETRAVRLERETRFSITFRWLLPEAHIVGEEVPNCDHL